MHMCKNFPVHYENSKIKVVQYSANEAVCQGSDDQPENGPHALCCMWAHMQHNACGLFSGWSSDHLSISVVYVLRLFLAFEIL